MYDNHCIEVCISESIWTFLIDTTISTKIKIKTDSFCYLSRDSVKFLYVLFVEMFFRFFVFLRAEARRI